MRPFVAGRTSPDTGRTTNSRHRRSISEIADRPRRRCVRELLRIDSRRWGPARTFRVSQASSGSRRTQQRIRGRVQVRARPAGLGLGVDGEVHQREGDATLHRQRNVGHGAIAGGCGVPSDRFQQGQRHIELDVAVGKLLEPCNDDRLARQSDRGMHKPGEQIYAPWASHFRRCPATGPGRARRTG